MGPKYEITDDQLFLPLTPDVMSRAAPPDALPDEDPVVPPELRQPFKVALFARALPELFRDAHLTTSLFEDVVVEQWGADDRKVTTYFERTGRVCLIRCWGPYVEQTSACQPATVEDVRRALAWLQPG